MYVLQAELHLVPVLEGLGSALVLLATGHGRAAAADAEVGGVDGLVDDVVAPPCPRIELRPEVRHNSLYSDPTLRQ